ncbi:MAG: signal peptidase II [Candidatus Saccharicenans sp.]
MSKKKLFYYVFILFWLALDQLTKYLVDRHISLYETKTVIPGFFNLTHVHNRGAIFGFLGNTDKPLALVFLNLGALVAFTVVVYYFIKTPLELSWMKVSFALIISGAMGNLLDRIFRGYVIDFLDFYVSKFHWPFFNVADSCITVGTLILVFIMLKGARDVTGAV